MSDLPGQPPYGTDPRVGGAVSPPPPPPSGYVGGAAVPPYGVQPYGYGYGSPQYGPGQPYGSGVYGWYVPHPEAPLGMASMAVGILSTAGVFVVPIFLLLAPVALILGMVGRSRVKKEPPGTYDTTKLTAGWILGLVGTGILVFSILMCVLFYAAIVSFAQQ